MKLSRVIVELIILSWLFLPRRTQAQSKNGRPEVQISKTTTAPVIDGVLSDEVWKDPPLKRSDWISYNPLYGSTVGSVLSFKRIFRLKRCGGAVSRPAPDTVGSLVETSGRGLPIELPSSEVRHFLEDGDEVILGGCCERAGFARIGFGECRGQILPALNL